MCDASRVWRWQLARRAVTVFDPERPPSCSSAYFFTGVGMAGSGGHRQSRQNGEVAKTLAEMAGVRCCFLAILLLVYADHNWIDISRRLAVVETPM